MVPANPNDFTIRPPQMEGKAKRMARRPRPASTSPTRMTRIILWPWTGRTPPLSRRKSRTSNGRERLVA